MHQLYAGAHEANGAVAQVMRLPAGTGGNACVAEQSGRDDAIGLAGKARVERARGDVAGASADPVVGGAVGR